MDALAVSDAVAHDAYRARVHIGPGARVLDVGANVGHFTGLALALGAAVVVAVEANPEHVAALRRRWPGVRTVHGAVGYPGEALCHLVSGGPFGSAEWSTGSWVAPGPGEPVVPALTLDDLVRAHGPFDFAKVDVEGAEYGFLTDAGSALAQVRHLAIEYHAWTVPGEAPRPGVGVRPSGPRLPGGALERLVASLAVTHEVGVEGDATGGYLHAERR